MRKLNRPAGAEALAMVPTRATRRVVTTRSTMTRTRALSDSVSPKVAPRRALKRRGETEKPETIGAMASATVSVDTAGEPPEPAAVVGVLVVTSPPALSVGVGETGSHVAVAERLPLPAIVHCAGWPAHAPVQPPNSDPESAVAVT